ncbi:hypothetical protein SAMN02746041_02066 [Desulfacinum hydrothermale DSM 13146]|uniref:Uncharacterized protein n=1 Tax=Desulfacinum hydrothermale DSM 13146 TaxID=1121390 RepID=A0A1W1XM73_9BACT|nr:hypothetical protein [Desulfacinum hydrothermale]SMC24628.1 hypothetical protein SAMN02746041_02066 [Desulfacinum hydrothermale DSM 13146]
MQLPNLHLSLTVVAAVVLCINLPFGYWRAQTQRFSRGWFLAIHVPVPLVVGLRIVSGLGWRLATFPVLIGAFFAGQLLGGLLCRLSGGKGEGSQ